MKMDSIYAEQVDWIRAILPSLQHLLGGFDSMRTKLPS